METQARCQDGLMTTSELTKNARESVIVRLAGPTPPSFKNKKMAVHDNTNGKLKTITEPKAKARKKKLEDDLVSALLSAYQTTAPATSTASSLRSWIASSLPADDSWKFVPKIEIEAVRSDESYLEIEIKPL